MARALIIGCGCHGRDAAAVLAARGWAVRGTSRSADGLAAIEEAGIEPSEADPDRVGSVVSQLGDVAVLCWLLGSAGGSSEELAALHGPRLERTLEKLVDSPVRGFVYEASGSVEQDLLDRGAATVGDAAQRWRIPAEVVRPDRGDAPGWAASVADAAERVLGL